MQTCRAAGKSGLAVAGEPRLNGIPQLPIDDRRVFAGIGPFLVNDVASVDAVLQHQVESAPREHHLVASAALRAPRLDLFARPVTALITLSSGSI